MRLPQIPDIHRDHLLDCATPGYETGHKLAWLWRAWRRSGRVMVTQRYRTPFTDAMSLPYHGGWVSFREVYVQRASGKEFLGRLYDKAPPPPSLNQRQLLAKLAAHLQAGMGDE